MNFQKSFSLILLLGCIAAQPAFADTYFDQGRILFEKHQFAKALPYFHKAAADSPWDSTAAYYEALCYHQLRDWKNAGTAYKGIMEHFPGSPAYNNALAALRVLDPAYIKQMNAAQQPAAQPSSSGGGGGSSSGNEDSTAALNAVQVVGPIESKIPVQRVVDKNWLDGSINGRSFKFDFSGDNTVISPKDAKSMNLPVTSGKTKVSIKVGQISETNFPLTIEETDRPKLGTDFFYKFAFTLDPSTITATKKAGGVAASGWDVPFRKKGKDMMIDIQVNGRRVSVILDADGGENVIPRARAKEFGMEASETSELNRFDPDTNPNGPVRGQEGFGEVKTTTGADGKVIVGPCSASVHFKIDDKATDAKVSKAIFGAWKYQMDAAGNRIHFTR
jgi:hypothetical protein